MWISQSRLMPLTMGLQSLHPNMHRQHQHAALMQSWGFAQPQAFAQPQGFMQVFMQPPYTQKAFTPQPIYTEVQTFMQPPALSQAPSSGQLPSFAHPARFMQPTMDPDIVTNVTQQVLLAMNNITLYLRTPISIHHLHLPLQRICRLPAVHLQLQTLALHSFYRKKTCLSPSLKKS